MEALMLVAFSGITLLFLSIACLTIMTWKRERDRSRKKNDLSFILAGLGLTGLTVLSQDFLPLIIYGLFMFVFVLRYQANRAAAVQ